MVFKYTMDILDDADGTAIVEYAAPKPAYATSGPDVLVAEGMHCSMYPGDFCFFCAYEKNTDAQGNEADLYSALVDLVNHMSALKREPAAIATHVFTQYNSSVRAHIDGQPAWSKASITRHIVYGGQFTAVFDTSVSAMFTALIARQNASLIDSATGLVIEENRKAFCDTVSAYAKWKIKEEAGGTRRGKGRQ